MTTQPHFTDTDETSGERDRLASDPQRTNLPPETTDALTTPTQPSEREENASVPTDEAPPAAREATPPVEQSRAAEVTRSSARESLFASEDLTGLRSRWDDVQAGFVDDPRMCVQTADGLVSDVVQQLTDGFSHARSRLEEQWARGEDVSTEDLRQALKRYREFFDRLLAV
ncbi:MAG: hypothetical protein QOD90_565 [Mycobacterium sp.]|jgi:hypothetical protein|nr:hypothetical protein [Mycobacterium sp.]